MNQDTLIIGAGFTGLLLAHRLTAAGHHVTLVEARDTLGGRFRRASTVEFYPATDENLAIFKWIKTVSPVPIEFSVREHRPEIYDDGRWRGFAGFGETEFKSASELAGFSATNEIVVHPTLDHVVRALTDTLPKPAQTLSEVTSLRVENHRVTAVTINGEKNLIPDTVIFTAHPAELNNLIEGDGLNPKHRARLAKMATWTAVELELHHAPPLVLDEGARLFSHNTKDMEPVVGRVYGERSLWMTLVPGDREADVEFVGQNIRHIKRQLKRAWPLDNLTPEEKIYVHAHAYGQQTLKTKDSLRVPEIKNLFLANHILGHEPGALGCMQVARDVEINLVSTPSANIETSHPEAQV